MLVETKPDHRHIKQCTKVNTSINEMGPTSLTR